MSIIKHRHINHVSKYKLPKAKKSNSSFKINKSTNKYKIPKNKKTSFNINKTAKYSTRNLDDIIDKRYLFISIILFLSFIIIGIRLFKLQILEYDNYNSSFSLMINTSNA